MEIANVMTEDCAAMCDDHFRAAIAEHRKSSPWFPTSYDILTKHRELRQLRFNRAIVFLPEKTLTPEQQAENVENLRRIKEMLIKKRTMKAYKGAL